MTKPTTCTVVVAATGATCGEPAVHAFIGTGGEAFAECATHATAHVGGATTHEHALGAHVIVKAYGKTYPAVVTTVTPTGIAYATFTTGKGTTKTKRIT